MHEAHAATIVTGRGWAAVKNGSEYFSFWSFQTAWPISSHSFPRSSMRSQESGPVNSAASADGRAQRAGRAPRAPIR